MVQLKAHILAPAITCLVAMACTSAIWIGAYYIGIKDRSQTNRAYSPVTPEPDVLTTTHSQVICHEACKFHLVESIPVNLTYNASTKFMSTTDAWLQLIANATREIRIASYYWSLLPNDTQGYADSTAEDGVKVYEALVDAGKRGIVMQITQNAQPNPETTYLQNNGWAHVRSLNFTRLLGSGILHTKAWLVDDQHLYIGSANIDWRSLKQVKELGVAFFNCPCVAADARKLFDVYWQMGAPNSQIPAKWPADLATVFNENNPISATLNQQQSAVYLSSAPPEFCPYGREQDIDAILRVIRTANEFIHIAVMDYIPAFLYTPTNIYWPVIDDALRSAAYSGKHVKLMMSRWSHTRRQVYAFLRSLADCNAGLPCARYRNPKTGRRECIANTTGSIEVRIFVVPSFGNQSHIPFARVNHNKYMVTDNSLYVGTSNWSGDYFVSTGGLGVVIQSDNSIEASVVVRDANENIFMRDWNSQYTKSIYDFNLEANRTS